MARYTYPYPRPAVTVDTVLCTLGARDELRVLLIERKRDPFAGAWALPGGFVDEHEDLPDAARREMHEETGVALGQLLQLGAYGTPDRDPRGHTVGVAYLAACGPDEVEAIAGDDAADCRWFSIRRPPRLAFDHGVILRDARDALARLAADRARFQKALFGRRKPPFTERLRRAARSLK